MRSSDPKFMFTVTALVAGMARLWVATLKLSRFRFRLAKPGASLNTTWVPTTAKLPSCVAVCGACKSSLEIPDQLIASFFPANKPDKKLTDTLPEVTCSAPTFPWALASNSMPL